ncbi:hypothetical protein RQP46_009505 [Phenoliferia psychrophenolica]
MLRPLGPDEPVTHEYLHLLLQQDTLLFISDRHIGEYLTAKVVTCLSPAQRVALANNWTRVQRHRANVDVEYRRRMEGDEGYQDEGERRTPFPSPVISSPPLGGAAASTSSTSSTSSFVSNPPTSNDPHVSPPLPPPPQFRETRSLAFIHHSLHKAVLRPTSFADVVAKAADLFGLAPESISLRAKFGDNWFEILEDWWITAASAQEDPTFLQVVVVDSGKGKGKERAMESVGLDSSSRELSISSSSYKAPLGIEASPPSRWINLTVRINPPVCRGGTSSYDSSDSHHDSIEIQCKMSTSAAKIFTTVAGRLRKELASYSTRLLLIMDPNFCTWASRMGDAYPFNDLLAAWEGCERDEARAFENLTGAPASASNPEPPRPTQPLGAGEPLTEEYLKQLLDPSVRLRRNMESITEYIPYSFVQALPMGLVTELHELWTRVCFHRSGIEMQDAIDFIKTTEPGYKPPRSARSTVKRSSKEEIATATAKLLIALFPPSPPTTLPLPLPTPSSIPTTPPTLKSRSIALIHLSLHKLIPRPSSLAATITKASELFSLAPESITSLQILVGTSWFDVLPESWNLAALTKEDPITLRVVLVATSTSNGPGGGAGAGDKRKRAVQRSLLDSSENDDVIRPRKNAGARKAPIVVATSTPHIITLTILPPPPSSHPPISIKCRKAADLFNLSPDNITLQFNVKGEWFDVLADTWDLAALTEDDPTTLKVVVHITLTVNPPDGLGCAVNSFALVYEGQHRLRAGRMTFGDALAEWEAPEDEDIVMAVEYTVKME